jgi:hypothetical protein
LSCTISNDFSARAAISTRRLGVCDAANTARTMTRFSADRTIAAVHQLCRGTMRPTTRSRVQIRSGPSSRCTAHSL